MNKTIWISIKGNGNFVEAPYYACHIRKYDVYILALPEQITFQLNNDKNIFVLLGNFKYKEFEGIKMIEMRIPYDEIEIIKRWMNWGTPRTWKWLWNIPKQESLKNWDIKYNGGSI